MISKKISIALSVSVTVLIIIIALLLNPIPQDLSYHNFADQRTWLNIVNAENVLSNIPLAMVGIWGLLLLFSPGKIQFIQNAERWPWVGILIGLILTAIGSSYYHLAADNARLLWDRLPMTIVFMSFITILINDKISIRVGLCLWPLLLFIGIFSVVYWHINDDLRFYVAVQIYALIVAFIMLFVPSHYTRNRDILVIIVFYTLAKLFETLDSQIYKLDCNIISGHTLKHLAATLAAIWLICMAWKRKIISPHQTTDKQ